mmetsp:Transcript_11157/g.24879  ORF Transcript_11157/g.24879 Transcript_11157/m.24879 type:complete len:344 (-) Transcript_11157:179-1210(-)
MTTSSNTNTTSTTGRKASLFSSLAGRRLSIQSRQLLQSAAALEQDRCANSKATLTDSSESRDHHHHPSHQGDHSSIQSDEDLGSNAAVSTDSSSSNISSTSQPDEDQEAAAMRSSPEQSQQYHPQDTSTSILDDLDSMVLMSTDPHSENQQKSSLKKNNCNVHKQVRFGTVTQHLHDLILGEHPSVSCGPPIALGWQRLATEEFVNVDAFEQEQQQYQQKDYSVHPNRMNSNIHSSSSRASLRLQKLRLSKKHRFRALLKAGVRAKHIRDCVERLERERAEVDPETLAWRRAALMQRQQRRVEQQEEQQQQHCMMPLQQQQYPPHQHNCTEQGGGRSMTVIQP